MASSAATCGDDNAIAEVIAALAKQLSLEIPVVERIFQAGISHAEIANKRRRIDDAHTSSTRSSNGTDAAAAEFKFTEGISFEQMRLDLAEFAKDRDWDQFHSPRNLALAMVGEVGELCECFQWKGDSQVTEGLPGWSEKHRTALRQEISDVLLYLVRLSHKCHVDLPKAAMDKLAVNAAKYPASLVRGSSKKYSEYKVGAESAGSEPVKQG
eukprot:TRINITY_DN80287_c0_g1_i1.p2 TRINITY_DN80287_c0_g1~~TRINITY_DN80287_c0_g1_i1.p2  ORF type:complete len:212 (+),score=53.01 TRINITY_DN80287_c0_g1_i1:28-663(+)